MLERLLSGKMVELNFSELSELILKFPDKINTLMIQKTFDGYCVIVDEISVRKEQEEKDMKLRCSSMKPEELNESMSLEELYLYMQERRKEKIALYKSKDYALEKAKKEYGDSLIGYVEYENGFKFYIGDITSDRCGTAYWIYYDDDKGIIFRWGGCDATYNIPKNIVKIER